MKITDYEKIVEITEQQERILRFNHFSNKDALDLGNFMVKQIYHNDMSLAIAIRRENGAILFQHMTEGANLNNQNWMKRKFKTVSLMEQSSLGAWAASKLSGETISVHGLSDADYVLCGGGFPIRLTTGEIVAILTVSNLPHWEDHQFIVDCLSTWLGEKDVPFIYISNE